MSYLTMRNNVLNRARQSGTWATARVNDYLNRAQRDMWNTAKEWKQLEKDSTTTAVVAQSNYSTPSDFIRPLYMELRDGSNKYPLTASEPDAVLATLASVSGNARPTTYCLHYQQLFFNRTFAAADTIYMVYAYTPADMSADGDTTPFGSNPDVQFILEEYAYGFLMRDLGRNKEFEISFALYKSMLEDFADSDGRNTNQVEGFYDGYDAVSPYWSESRMWGGYNYWRDNG